MTNGNILPAAFAVPQAQQPVIALASRSQQSWLLELERAQAGLLGQPSDSAHAASQPRPPQDTRQSDEKLRDLPSGQTLLPLNQPFTWLPPEAAPTTAAAAEVVQAMQTTVVTQTSSILVGSTVVSGMRTSDTEILEAADVQLPVLGDTLPGRERHELGKTSFKFLSVSEGVVDAAVRDPALTLESELRLSQHIRAAVQAVGSKLGRVWLNGRDLKNSQGEQDGN